MSTENCRILENRKTSKTELRKAMIKRREECSVEYCERSDKAIVERLLGLEAYKKARTIFTYVSRGKETDTWQLLNHILRDQKRAAVPRCILSRQGEGGIMKAYELKALEELEPGAFGIMEPKGGCREVGPEELSLAVIPCVACSESGVRLGWGGGYYDRYLALTPALRVVLCREHMICEGIPKEAHDCSADYVVTEKRVLILSEP